MRPQLAHPTQISHQRTLLSDSPGVAWAVNSYGHVVGYREKKGLMQPTLWVK
jgi:hypothetical protein